MPRARKPSVFNGLRAFCVFGKCQKIMKNQAKKSKITQKNKCSGRGPVTCLQLTWRKPSVYAGVSDLGLQKKLNALECVISF